MSRAAFEATFPAFAGPLSASDEATRDQWLSVWQAATERAAKVLTDYQVPVGNSSAGEIAAEMTMDALRECRAFIRGEP